MRGFLGSAAIAGILVGGLFFGSGVAQASSVNLVTCEADSGSTCGNQGGSATITFNGADTLATITITLTGTGTDGQTTTFTDPQDASLGVNILGTTITGATITSGSGWSYDNFFHTYNFNTTGGNVIDNSEFGTNGYLLGSFKEGINCTDNTCGSTVTLTVSGTGLYAANDNDGYVVGADTQQQGSCAYGYDGYCYSYNVNEAALGGALSATPLPATLPLFGTALGLGGLMFRKRRQKKDAVAA